MTSNKEQFKEWLAKYEEDLYDAISHDLEVWILNDAALVLGVFEAWLWLRKGRMFHVYQRSPRRWGCYLKESYTRKGNWSYGAGESVSDSPIQAKISLMNKYLNQ